MGKQREWWLAVDEYAVVYRWNKSNRNPDSDIRINLAQVVQSKKTGEMFLQLEVQDGDFAPASPSSLEAMVQFENEVEETIGIVFSEADSYENGKRTFNAIALRSNDAVKDISFKENAPQPLTSTTQATGSDSDSKKGKRAGAIVGGIVAGIAVLVVMLVLLIPACSDPMKELEYKGLTISVPEDTTESTSGGDLSLNFDDSAIWISKVSYGDGGPDEVRDIVEEVHVGESNYRQVHVPGESFESAKWDTKVILNNGSTMDGYLLVTCSDDSLYAIQAWVESERSSDGLKDVNSALRTLDRILGSVRIDQ